jgi:hypothetical protein
MKKLLLLQMLFILYSCSENILELTDKVKSSFRATAYTSLSEREKESLIINWEEAPVMLGTYVREDNSNIFLSNENRMFFILLNSSVTLSNNQNLAAVIFNTNLDPLLGPIIIIIDPVKDKTIGGVLRL